MCPAPAIPARPTISPGAAVRLTASSRPETDTPSRRSGAVAAPAGSTISVTRSASSRASSSGTAGTVPRRRSPSIASTIAVVVSPARGTPSRTARPSRSTVTSSQSPRASSRMCETNTTATCRPRRTRSTPSSVSALARSSAEVGSSRMSTRGRGHERLGDLDELALCERQRPDRRAQRHVEPELGQDGPRALGHLGAPDERAAPRLAHREEVAEHVEVAEQVELLRDDRDAVARRVGGAGEDDLATVEAQRPRVGPHGAGDDLDERRLARSVLAEQGVDRARADRESGAVERLDPAVGLRDPDGLEHGAGGAYFPPGSGCR